MQLKEFVAETLQQIMDGVIEAQKAAKAGAEINPASAVIQPSQSGSPLGASDSGWRMVQGVEFDVAVTATNDDEKKAGIGVLGGILSGGASAKKQVASQSATRIKFTVPIVLPWHLQNAGQTKEQGGRKT